MPTASRSATTVQEAPRAHEDLDHILAYMVCNERTDWADQMLNGEVSCQSGLSAEDAGRWHAVLAAWQETGEDPADADLAFLALHTESHIYGSVCRERARLDREALSDPAQAAQAAEETRRGPSLSVVEQERDRVVIAIDDYTEDGCGCDTLMVTFSHEGMVIDGVTGCMVEGTMSATYDEIEDRLR